MPDGGTSDAQNALQTGSVADVVVEKKLWIEKARAFLKKRGGGAAAAGPADPAALPPRKRYRVKSYHWLHAVDAQLRSSDADGNGLAKYIINDIAAAGDPAYWPRLFIAPDHGPDGVCAIQFLRYYLNANVDEHFDLSHGVSI